MTIKDEVTFYNRVTKITNTLAYLVAAVFLSVNLIQYGLSFLEEPPLPPAEMVQFSQKTRIELYSPNSSTPIAAYSAISYCETLSDGSPGITFKDESNKIIEWTGNYVIIY